MRIMIEYESSWRNSFLDGTNDEPLPKKGRSFVASMTELKKPENYFAREVTKSTVMGVLNRLIGDQRKLYQSRQNYEDVPYYFADVESKVSFVDKPTAVNTEITYIRNLKGSTDQNSFTGMIKVNDPIFKSNYSQDFWSVLALDVDELCNFIIDGKLVHKSIELTPLGILSRLEEIKKFKNLDYANRVKQASDLLSNTFKEDYKPFDKKDVFQHLALYCSALYLQMFRLEEKYDMHSAKSSTGRISGISKNGFTSKDFMKNYVTGGKKLIYGNPYIREEYVKGKDGKKGEGKIKHTLKKASGTLEIIIDISFDAALELKQLINDAGVSSFYLGKKGLAYVSDIDIREVA